MYAVYYVYINIVFNIFSIPVDYQVFKLAYSAFVRQSSIMYLYR